MHFQHLLYYLNLHHIVVKEGKNTYYNDKGEIIKYTPNVPDCIVNNYFKSSISKHMFDISIPDKFNGEAIDCRNLILLVMEIRQIKEI